MKRSIILLRLEPYEGKLSRPVLRRERGSDSSDLADPKLKNGSDERDLLVAWTEFLKDPESEKVRGLELSIEEIREAKDELIRMSNDSKQREIYEMRAKILKDKISELNEAERKGVEKGRKDEKIEIAKNLLDILDNETIALKTGLTIDEVQQLR